MAKTTLYWQGSLFDAGLSPAIPADMPIGRRIRLDRNSWVDLYPGWVRGADALLALLAEQAPWQPQGTRIMWENLVRVPRILARWPDLSTLPPVLVAMRRALANRYGIDFDLVAVNLYRSGRDSVAWHGDRVRLTHTDPMVATVSLGDRRRFLLRPRGGGRAVLSLRLGAGDLLMMGGACQHDYEHCVPKVAYAGARMSVTFRHSAEARRGPPPGHARHATLER